MDFETGVDGATCGALLTPCKSILYGIDNAGVGDDIRVDETTAAYAYMGLNLGFGKSLIAEDFVAGDDNALAEPDTIIDGGNIALGSAALTVPATSPGGSVIQGFRFRATTFPISLEATASMVGNTIDEDMGTTTGCLVRVQNSGNTSTIGPGNAFVDPTPDATPQAGICVTTSAAPSISSNTFTDLNHGVQSGGTDLTIESNVFTGTRGATSNAAIEVTSGFITVTANAIHSPGDPFVVGIVLQQTGATPDVGAQLRRNTILSHRVGFAANNTEFPVYLNGDLIAKSAQVGLSLGDSDDDGDGEVQATNITIADSLSTDVSVAGGELTLSSSLLGSSGPGIIGSGVTPTCDITFSRGPVMTPSASGCTNFQTTATPGFVDPDTDYHLAPGSPMIDMGDPAAPPPGVFDLDGGARATDGNGDGTVRRDIGADETATVQPTPTPPTPANPAAPGAAKKKCKKKRKRKGSATVAAKRKKCKRKRKK